MAAKKAAAKKKTTAKVAPELVHEEGYWWMVKGTTRVNLGRNERYARAQMEEMTAK